MESPYLVLFPSFLAFCFVIIATTATDILPGTTLAASHPTQNWASPDNTFFFGFTLNPEKTAYFAAITYDRSPGIPVWVAGGSAPGQGACDSMATFRFLTNGNLQLVNGSNGAIVWQSDTAGLGATSASVDDSGKLSLMNGTDPVWSSFDDLTDTILPNQNFTVKDVLRSGPYSFRLHKSGNLTLRWNDSIEYYNTGLNLSSVNANFTSPSLGLQPIGIISLFDPMLSTPVIMVYSSDFAEGNNILRFVKLDSDGNLRMYSSSRGSGTQNVRWEAVTDQCQVFAYCGNMGICSYNDSVPVCGCPSQNFDPVDPGDSRKGCKRKVEIKDCPETDLIMMRLEHTMFLTYPPELSSQLFSMGISPCGSNCLGSSPCSASTSMSDGTGMCAMKDQDSFNGYQSPALLSTSFVKVCGPVMPNPSPTSLRNGNSKGWRLRVWIVVLVVLATILGFLVLEVFFWWWCCRNGPKFGGLSSQYALLEYASGAPVQFSYKDLQNATKGFREKLGAGGFGAVYRGLLANKTVVAVKQLEGIEQGEKQFRMEVATISSTHHLNLVRLIGFCSEGRHRLLVYEFMKNGSLDNFLFMTDEQPVKLLNWEHRFNIALGTARGITYLHEECRDCIVHCDIKPENILLDENYNAKVSDFGLAKLINPKDHRYRTLTSVRGTRGYLAPEWLANLPITSKSDVYSYGMVLLEIVSGRRNFEVSAETNRRKFSMWAYEEFEKGNVEAVLDKRIPINEADMEQVVRAIQISFWCIQEQPSQRPVMGKVVQMLEGITIIDRPPAPQIVTEGSISGTSVNASSVSALSTFAASAPAPSSSSSFQTAGISSFVSGKTVERGSSLLLQAEEK